MKITTLGIDLAKTVFQLHGVDKQGNVVFKQRVSRAKLAEVIAKLEPCTIVMEACGGANYWYRKFSTMGHAVKLISPQFVKPYVKGNKNDYQDAAAIAEAATRPHMRFVPAKRIEQQDIQCLHRVRSRLVAERTALVNQIRGLLAEYGIVAAQGIHKLRQALPLILEEADNELTVQTRALFADLHDELVALDKRIHRYEQQLAQVAKAYPACQRLLKVEGIGILAATAMVAAVGNPHVFKNGRQLAAWLGLVPKQHSSGNKTRLLGMSKRGDSYLRTLLIHGARSVLRYCVTKHDSRSVWLQQQKARKGGAKASVALANKNARIIWALLAKDSEYRQAA